MTLQNNVVTFPSGAFTLETVEIPIVDDVLVESEEIFFVLVTSSDPRVQIPDSPLSVTIVDNDGQLKVHACYVHHTSLIEFC